MITQPQIDALSSGVVLDLYEWEHPDGMVRYTTAQFAWTDPDGLTWLTSPLLSVGGQMARAEFAGSTLSLTWSAAAPELLAAAQDARILGTTFRRYIAILDGEPLTRVGGNILLYQGVVEVPDIDGDPENPLVRLVIESDLRLIDRASPYRLTPDSLGLFQPGDTAANFVATFTDKNLFVT